jgi:aspartyl-tRNA(Asn)/glutamyl-tRNA(Gln) amidotransferase subunit C
MFRNGTPIRTASAVRPPRRGQVGQNREVLMSVDSDTVRRIARLARIAVDDQQVAAMEKELNALLAWVEQLSEVDVTGVPPMTSVVAHRLKMRDDIISDGERADDILKNAPQSENGFFLVPKVVE